MCPRSEAISRVALGVRFSRAFAWVVLRSDESCGSTRRLASSDSARLAFAKFTLQRREEEGREGEVGVGGEGCVLMPCMTVVV